MDPRDIHLRDIDLRLVCGEDSGKCIEHHSGCRSCSQQRRTGSRYRSRETRGNSRGNVCARSRPCRSTCKIKYGYKDYEGRQFYCRPYFVFRLRTRSVACPPAQLAAQGLREVGSVGLRHIDHITALTH